MYMQTLLFTYLGIIYTNTLQQHTVKFIDFVSAGIPRRSTGSTGLHKVDVTGELPSLAMEFVCGRNLAVEHEQKRLGLIEVQRLASQLLSSLEHIIHEKNVTHCDLTPTNILVVARSPLQIKLADFGLATFNSKNESPDPDKLGDHPFKAPEIMTGRTYPDKVDIWAVGIIMLHLMTGLPPYPDQHWK